MPYKPPNAGRKRRSGRSSPNRGFGNGSSPGMGRGLNSGPTESADDSWPPPPGQKRTVYGDVVQRTDHGIVLCFIDPVNKLLQMANLDKSSQVHTWSLKVGQRVRFAVSMEPNAHGYFEFRASRAMGVQRLAHTPVLAHLPQVVRQPGPSVPKAEERRLSTELRRTAHDPEINLVTERNQYNIVARYQPSQEERDMIVFLMDSESDGPAQRAVLPADRWVEVTDARNMKTERRLGHRVDELLSPDVPTRLDAVSTDNGQTWLVQVIYTNETLPSRRSLKPSAETMTLLYPIMVDIVYEAMARTQAPGKDHTIEAVDINLAEAIVDQSVESKAIAFKPVTEDICPSGPTQMSEAVGCTIEAIAPTASECLAACSFQDVPAEIPANTPETVDGAASEVLENSPETSYREVPEVPDRPEENVRHVVEEAVEKPVDHFQDSLSQSIVESMAGSAVAEAGTVADGSTTEAVSQAPPGTWNFDAMYERLKLAALEASQESDPDDISTISSSRSETMFKHMSTQMSACKSLTIELGMPLVGQFYDYVHLPSHYREDWLKEFEDQYRGKWIKEYQDYNE